jgi:hypothetical protein
VKEGKDAGEIVRRVSPWILLVLVTLASVAPRVARAGTPSPQNTSQASAMKNYLKHQKNGQKKFRKGQKKAENRLRKLHHEGR